MQLKKQKELIVLNNKAAISLNEKYTPSFLEKIYCIIYLLRFYYFENFPVPRRKLRNRLCKIKWRIQIES